MSELPGSLDERGNRVRVHPADVRGRYVRRRAALQLGLLAAFLALPHLRIRGAQALLLDLSGRRFAVFGLRLWAQDAPKLFLLLGTLVFLACFATAAWGRIWCGWACPQTVLTESLYRRIERWVEGEAPARRRLDAAPPLAWPRFWRKALKWLLFLGTTVALVHAFLSIFAGSDRVAAALAHPEGSRGLLGAGAFLTALVLFDAGWFREQFCIVLCPYGRFQSLLMDRGTVTVAYDAARGEPRGPGHQGGGGDCVDCRRCVQVCPTGIDIRKGLQMECLACTACADACDEVMTRLERPAGLVGYRTGDGGPRRLRPRALAYLGLTLAFGGGLTYALAARQDVDIVPLRGLDRPYQEVRGPGGEPLVVNHLRFELLNLTGDPKELALGLPPELTARGFTLVSASNPLPLPAGRVIRTDLFVTFPKAALAGGRAAAALEFREQGRVTARKDVVLLGPYR